VDDNPVNRLVTTAQLEALGYTADAAESGEVALAILAEQPYDIVLMDCGMPRLDGYETCRRLRQLEGDGRRTWVIALTAYAAPGEREKCLAAGMDDYLGKPLQADELAAMLNRTPPAAESHGLAERLEALERLGEQTGCDVLGQVIQSFLERGVRDLETLRRALAQGDATALAAAAHSLAGSSGILGATGLSKGCVELEELARRGDLAACETRLDAVEQAYQRVAGRLSEVGTLPGSTNAAWRPTHNKC